MIPAGHEVWLALEPIDMRSGIDGLSLRVRQQLGSRPTDGRLYAFRNRRGNRLALLVWDGTGVWLAKRRLDQGRFTWPQSTAPLHPLEAAQWQALLTGVDWQRLVAKASPQWRL